jgi:Xaa-Pro dipeptidase
MLRICAMQSSETLRTSRHISFDLEANRTTLYRERHERVRAFMVKHNVPAAVILDPNNITYATGANNMTIFTSRTPARYLLLFAEAPAILYDFKGSDHLSAHLETIGTIKAAEGLDRISSGGDAQGAAKRFALEIQNQVHAVDPTIDRIAIDRFPFYVTDALRDAGFTLVDADDFITDARTLKLPIELEYLREAMRRVDEATLRLESKALPGQTESEIWAEFHYGLMAKQGQYVSTRLFQSGPNTYPYFQECGSRLVEAGDLLCLDTDAIGFESYAVDFSRTFLCGDGRASDIQRKLYGRARDQLEHNASLLRPGIAFEELAQRAWKIPSEHLASRYYCIGHGLGMSGEFPNIPHFTPGQEYPLKGVVEPGMIICIESYVGLESSAQGVKLEDQFLIGENTVKCMSTYAFDSRLG